MKTHKIKLNNYNEYEKQKLISNLFKKYNFQIKPKSKINQ
jgi:hypothetical protein